jgi:hypothetical protein
LLDAGVVSRVDPIDGIDWRRGDVVEVAAVPFEVRVLGTREAVSRLVLLLMIDVRVVRSNGGVRSLTTVAAGIVLAGGILVAGVSISAAGALLGEV